MTAEEKFNELGGEAFYRNFVDQMKLSNAAGCLEWLGFGVKSTGRLAIEANVANSAVRLSFNFSLAEGKAECCLNVRARSDVFDGDYTHWRPAFLDTVLDGFARAPGPHAGIKNQEGDAYVKPFGCLRDAHQVDVYFDARHLGLDSLVRPCAVLNESLEMNLREAVQLTLSWLRLCNQQEIA